MGSEMCIRDSSKMDDDISDVVNDAIEYMPGRIRRQLWAEQAQILLE